MGIGGAAGAVLRYAISMIPCRSAFPVSTLLINVFGALLIGYIAGFAGKKNIPENMTLLLKTGLCGGFTTFSTFSLEAYNLLRSGSYGLMGLYISLSVIGSVIGVWCGSMLAS